MRPEIHFDGRLPHITLGVTPPAADNDLEQSASAARGVLGAGLLILTTVGGIVLGCVLAFLAGRAA
ncbi:hypothetical protein VQ02_33530 [Methylobacterium variabile]|uniref:Uncharacterized protein n=1 Tax=Methylobacterium variabile TaxID=298794 RepID=A0A0J6S133_9HYPH|nr:hypothetical protein [Methylobacterium variabile]KMO27272.1 hypothetical protein VQ02_33530 [Methylobacterium variabile]